MFISPFFTIYMLKDRSHEQKNARSENNLFYSIFCRLGAAFKGTQIIPQELLVLQWRVHFWVIVLFHQRGETGTVVTIKNKQNSINTSSINMKKYD